MFPGGETRPAPSPKDRPLWRHQKGKREMHFWPLAVLGIESRGARSWANYLWGGAFVLCVRFNQCSTRRPSPERPIKRDNAVSLLLETPKYNPPTHQHYATTINPISLGKREYGWVEPRAVRQIFGGSRRTSHRRLGSFRLSFEQQPVNALFHLTPQQWTSAAQRTNAEATPWQSDVIDDAMLEICLQIES